MQIQGTINAYDDLMIALTIIGFRGEMTVDAIVDPGFTGSLYLPATMIAQLGMDLDGTGTSRLADGSRTRDLIFNGKIKWMGRVVPVKAALSFSDEVLVWNKVAQKMQNHD